MNSSNNLSQASLLDLQRHRLEILLDTPTKNLYRPSRLATTVRRLSQGLVHWLTEGSTPRITKQVHGGIETWRVYDPVGDRTVYFSHEDSLRTWLEQRYY